MTIIGLDVGGTHADVVLLGDCGVERQIKVPTDHSDLFNTVLAGLDKIVEGIDREKIDRVVLSTTLTTNAIVQNKLAPTAMIVAGGPGIDPENYRAGDNYYSVSGAIDHRGRETAPIDSGQIEKIGESLAKDEVRCAGVVGKFSVRNPSHETRIAEILGKHVEKVFLGCRVSGKLNFPRRIATTYLNAAVYPIHKSFFEAVRRSLKQKGLDIPIHILKADGGTMNFESSVDYPCQTILSGPAASVMGAIAFASAGEETFVLKIGGTTTDMAVLIDRSPLLNPLGIQLGPFKTILRSLETKSVGIGGDSYVRVEDGQLKIGPERMGPAMVYGGPAPTPTDAVAVLGMIDGLDKGAGAEGIRSLAAALGFGIEETARAIFDKTCEEIVARAREMVDEINAEPVYTVHEAYENYTVEPKKVLVLGGPARLFAQNLEKLFGVEVQAVPDWSVANAIGAAAARTTCEATLHADTEQGFAMAPEENFSLKIPKNFTKKQALEIAFDLLEKKAMGRGADKRDLVMEVLEEMEFNMVRGFHTAGKNIRVKVQVKPGLVRGFDKKLRQKTDARP